MDAGDYHVLYDDGDEQWEPLGTRVQYKWTSERLTETQPTPTNQPGAPPIPSRPKPKRMLSEKSTLAAMPEAKHSTSRDDVDDAAADEDVLLT